MRDQVKPPALIAGGHFHSLGAARNLAKFGVPVHVLDATLCVSQFSRTVRQFHKCPPTKNEDEYVGFILDLATRAGLEGAVLFPSDDESVRILAQRRERFSEHYCVTTPPWEVIRFLYDKRLTRDLAIRQGVPIPGTLSPKNLAELRQLGVEYPVVLKPAISTHLSLVTKKKAYRADNEAQMAEIYELMAAIMDPAEIMVQELIPGRAENLYSYVGYFRQGQPVAGLSARRPRQHPMDFGRASTFVETVDRPELGVLATRFLSGIGFTGLAEVEFMYDTRHERFELIEVNPRIWGWHTIAIRAGLDLPYLAYTDVLGQPIPMGPARSGVKWVRLVTDVPTAISEMRAHRLTMGQYLSSLSGNTEISVFSLRDPLASLADVLLVPLYMRQRGL